jgi:50S ribosomal subunit-associated GTPase HflX
VPTGTAAVARDALQETFETAEYAVQLPYDDTAHALVSTLHDRVLVHTTEYDDDAIYLHVEVAQSAVRDLRRRVSTADGSIAPIPPEK